MKKFLSVGVILVALLAISGFTGSLLAAEILFIEGNVQAQISPDKAWKKAEPGMQLKIGDSVKTARRSKADILLNKEQNHSIRIEERTMLVLDSTSPGLINKIDLSEGKIYAKVENVMAGLSFEVATPSSVAGVRGTGWSVGSERERDEVATYEGHVNLQAYDQQNNLISEMNIPAGFQTGVERFEGPGALTQVSERDMERWSQVRQDLVQHIMSGPVIKQDKGTGSDTGALDEIHQIAEGAQEKLSEIKTSIEEKGTEEIIEERTEECEEEW